jgi:HPr kinase/phosphorylase
MNLIHASCVVLGDSGVLIRGPAGAGKSGLALQMIDAGAELVADDYCELSRDGERLRAAPPTALAGKLEVRGLGIIALAFRPYAFIDLAVDLEPALSIERLPLQAHCDIGGVRVACLKVDGSSPTAAACIRLALRVARGIVPLLN